VHWLDEGAISNKYVPLYRRDVTYLDLIYFARRVILCPIGLVDIIFGIFSCTGYKYPFRGLDVGYGGVLSLRSNIPGSAPCATLDIYDLSVQGDFFQRRG
jgi:hypothetical protein